ncbi:Stage V sporulation protein B [Paenibacillus solanacearum]|uniref:Stage V sporulation protein B n=1 Tax=Paenibacillus solanacearum TaxID=2048548 RepID=A0A916K2F4_9BACL|nr:stage V sporulation protein B [Paenibacillus solanacearum]CAG7632490.1 Stage V sporulation protein B [Paenibacillus solanacearum]
MRNKQSFVRGTVILTISAFITRMLGFVNSIVMARYLGPEGIGLMMIAQPLVPIIVTLTSLGLPVAISKLVAEAEVRDDQAKVKRILTVSLTITGSISIVLTLFSFFGAKLMSAWILSDPRAYYAMLAIIPIAPLVAVSSVIKGYFGGKQQMSPLAVSDVVEQVIRIALIAALVQYLLPFGIEYAAAGAMISTVIGEGAGLLYLMLMLQIHRRKRERQSFSPRWREEKKTLVELLEIGLPTTGQGFIHSIYRALQPLIITKSMAIAGISAVVATKQYGLLAGYTFPLLVFPSFIMHSLSTALIPAISEAKAQGNGQLIHQRLDQAIRIALIIGAPCTAVLYVWAFPLTTAVYHMEQAGEFLKLLAPIFLLQYFEPPLHAVLIGLGLVNTVMKNFIATTIVKAIAIFALGSIMGIHGIIWGMNIGICLITMLNFLSLSKSIGFTLDIRTWFKVALSLAAMVLIGHHAFVWMQDAGYTLLLSVIGSISVALLAYIVSLLATNTVKRNDVQRFPVIRKMFT